jgi:hypothetical protein
MMFSDEQIDNIFEIVRAVDKLTDEELVKELSIAPGMESGDKDDPSRIWTKALQNETLKRIAGI